MSYEFHKTEMKPELYSTVTPPTYYNDIEVPLIVHQGNADDVVPFDWSQTFLEELDAADVQYDFMSIPAQIPTIPVGWPR